MKKIFIFILFFSALIFNSQELLADYKINLNKILNNKDKKPTSKDVIADDDNILSISGKFHFFWSSSFEEDQYKLDKSHSMMQNDAVLNFAHTGNINEYQKYLLNFNIKKKFNNNERIRALFSLEDTNYGKVELSNYSTIDNNLFVNTYWIKRGSDGAWDRNINLNLKTTEAREYSILSSVLSSYDTTMTYGGDIDTSSITYYTPEIQGFTLGASYTPKIYYDKVKNPTFDYQNVLTVAGMYHRTIDEDLELRISALGEYGSPTDRSAKYRDSQGTTHDVVLSDLNAWHLSMLMKYSKLSFAGSFGYFGNSGHHSKIPIVSDVTGYILYAKPKESYYFDLAASYDINDKTGVSIAYFNSVYAQDYASNSIDNLHPATNGSVGRGKLQNISLGIDYKLLDDYIKPYIEINRFIVSDNDALLPEIKRSDNIGWVIVLGTKSKF